jgi:hypothetical protein
MQRGTKVCLVTGQSGVHMALKSTVPHATESRASATALSVGLRTNFLWETASLGTQKSDTP